ncbi:3' exoribonuclease domain-containing protein [Naegleria gruberi]|uniref:3' exoribonuclease domain-containing protein n=1 Tax=Naegleria gruberi TaxID=5762 RepID=D2VE23_NAEGR|nr:3' exoribonuclease domain-containing protein [Naegleria gruberi]EFC45096.1 3' exoribonuclease domain-containing protein [Naegleria gruberi]|eukprot:XP_002677840.1 3' exoribonuclease domain-containing protein [Naegleria gruberi strain NEG-M]
MSLKPSALSSNEKNFILTTLDENKPIESNTPTSTNKSDSKKSTPIVSSSSSSSLPSILRIDGRDLYDYRSIEFSLPTSSQELAVPSGQVQVTLGNTIALGIVSCSIMEPYMDRPNEGFLTFQIDFSTVGSRPIGTKQTSQQRELCIEIGRVIDRSLRGSRSIDTEALCIIAGRKVWSLRVDVHILQDDGNVFDCCHLAAVAALLHFKRPEVTIEGDRVVVHTVQDRQPVPLSVHHIPICTSFSFFDHDSATLFVVDPCKKEEMIAEGFMTIALNAHKELCAIQKGGGLALTKDQILECAQIGSVKSKEITETLKQFLQAEESKRIQQGKLQYVKYEENPTKVEEEQDEEDSAISDISEPFSDMEDDE